MAQKSSWNMYYNCMQESELSEVTLTHHQVRDTIPTSLPWPGPYCFDAAVLGFHNEAAVIIASLLHIFISKKFFAFIVKGL